MKTRNPAALGALAKGDIENFLVAATPGGIEAQEKRGQMALVNSTDMPKEMRPSKEAFEKMGFTFGEPIDELFLSATLPPGWKRAATGHSMHSNIIDDQGRERVSIFYKAAFYDRRADANLSLRFNVRWLYPDDEGSGLAKDQVAYIVTDGGKEIFRTEPHTHRDWPTDEKRKEIALAWLKERYPDWGDPTAYW